MQERQTLPADRVELATRRCGQHDHHEIVAPFSASRTRPSDVRALLDTFERAVAEGDRFAPGDLVRVGGGLVRLEERGHALWLAEPDFTLPTLRFVPGVDATLAHLRDQEAVARAMGVAPRHVPIDAAARVCCELDGKGFVIDRGEDGALRIGCCVETNAEDAHALVTLSVHEVICLWPALVPFLALPHASSAAVIPGRTAIVHAEGREHVMHDVVPPVSGVRAMPIARALR